MDALRKEILSYKPGKAVPCDDKRVVFPDKLVIGMANEYFDGKTLTDFIHALRYALHGEEEAKRRELADKCRTSIEKQQGLWITDSISLIIGIASRPDTGTSEAEGTEGAIRDLAEKVGCIVKIVGTIAVGENPSNVEELKKIEEITDWIGRFPVCALLPSYAYMDEAISALAEIGMTHFHEVPFPANTRSDEDKLKWLHLLHKCLPEGDIVLAANDLKKICTNPRCESFYEKTKKDLEEANQEIRSLQQKNKELEQTLQEFLASPKGNDKALDKALENWKRTTKLQLESEIRAAEQQKKAGE